jgi:hypothetical protein
VGIGIHSQLIYIMLGMGSYGHCSEYLEVQLCLYQAKIRNLSYAIDFPTVQFCINIAPLGNEHLFCVLVYMNWLRVGFWVLGQYV